MNIQMPTFTDYINSTTNQALREMQDCFKHNHQNKYQIIFTRDKTQYSQRSNKSIIDLTDLAKQILATELFTNLCEYASQTSIYQLKFDITNSLYNAIEQSQAVRSSLSAIDQSLDLTEGVNKQNNDYIYIITKF